mgnify:CR=1 FL=1
MIELFADVSKQVKDRTTLAYLYMLNSMRNDYETVKDTDKCIKICIEIERFIATTKLEDDKLGAILLASYDTRARMGDFRAYCIALEWNRPIEKQFLNDLTASFNVIAVTKITLIIIT